VARTGKWWAHQHFKGVVPDIMLFAKGIASGFPFAGIAAKPEMYQGLPTGSLVGLASPLRFTWHCCQPTEKGRASLPHCAAAGRPPHRPCFCVLLV